ncbi:MAG: hypothetical protein A3I12_01205 [Gammaproteobacteria bacterium RIFCSPLOWO2_02_FULL_38_11]|nr:MAG: hypothetical protein A3I12_01205 [Gammaproteobacteria bacterium RIFCSPLOWO2_02_FULL_38_11]
MRKGDFQGLFAGLASASIHLLLMKMRTCAAVFEYQCFPSQHSEMSTAPNIFLKTSNYGFLNFSSHATMTSSSIFLNKISGVPSLCPDSKK